MRTKKTAANSQTSPEAAVPLKREKSVSKGTTGRVFWLLRYLSNQEEWIRRAVEKTGVFCQNARKQWHWPRALPQSVSSGQRVRRKENLKCFSSRKKQLSFKSWWILKNVPFSCDSEGCSSLPELPSMEDLQSTSSPGLIWKVLQCPCSGRNCWREGVFLRDLSGSQGQQVGSEDNHACWGGLKTWLLSPDLHGGRRKAPPASCSPTSWCVPWRKCP